MKVPYSWLKEYVDIDITAEELQDRLFSCGFEAGKQQHNCGKRKNKNEFYSMAIPNKEVPMEVVGNTLMGSEKYQYVLPFEFISVFLLACIIGGIVISRKDK